MLLNFCIDLNPKVGLSLDWNSKVWSLQRILNLKVLLIFNKKRLLILYLIHIWNEKYIKYISLHEHQYLNSNFIKINPIQKRKYKLPIYKKLKSETILNLEFHRKNN